MLKCIAVLVLFSCCCASKEDTKLLLLQMLFRHGDRSPHKTFISNTVTWKDWPEGLDRLTKLGKRQQYALGKVLRSMYNNFITSNPNEVLVNSSELDYAIRSAESNLASLYEPTEEWKFVEDFNWQPIPVHYSPKETDKYLYPWSTCPLYDQEIVNTFQSPEFQKELSVYMPMLKEIGRITGLKTWMDFLRVFDFIDIQKKHGFPVPEWPDLYQKEIQSYEAFMIKTLFWSKEIKRLRGGPFLGAVTENMKKKLLGETPDLKVRMFSSHDLSIVAVLKALNVYETYPDHCATLLFELHEMLPSHVMSVRLLYLNSTEPEKGYQVPYVLKLKGCSEYCPLEFFIEYAKPMIPDDWEKECQLD